jgi:hypothetical protein
MLTFADAAYEDYAETINRIIGSLEAVR